MSYLEHLEKREKCCEQSSALNYEWIFFILSDKKDNYESLDEFEFR